MEHLKNDSHNTYPSAMHNFDPFFDLEAFKLCSDSTFPAVIFWGASYNCYFNTNFATLMHLNNKNFFGKEGRSVFSQAAWNILEPELENVIEEKSSLGTDAQLIYLERKGFTEECYFDYCMEPITVGDEVFGVYCTFVESTKRVIDERRLELLNQLSNDTVKAQSTAQACEMIATILNRFTSDIPFNLTFILDHQKNQTDPFCSSGLPFDLKGLSDQMKDTDEIKYVGGLSGTASQAVLIPIKRLGRGKPFAMVIFGISPNLELNDDYKNFHLLLARFLTSVLTKTQLIEGKQKDLIARDEFISIASHEFKTPITALKLRLAITRRKIMPEKNICPTPDEIIQCIDTADQQADRLTKLVDELLDMTRIQRGKFKLTYEDFKVKALMDAIINRFSDELERNHNKLSLEIENDLCVCWHMSRIDQVFSNLISNSIKYAPGSNINIKVASGKNLKVDIDYFDDGPGIPIERQSKIFDRFEQANSSQRVGGLGLGLYIVREIIRGHDGTIKVESEPGKGTRFLISLPSHP